MTSHFAKLYLARDNIWGYDDRRTCERKRSMHKWKEMVEKRKSSVHYVFFHSISSPRKLAESWRKPFRVAKLQVITAHIFNNSEKSILTDFRTEYAQKNC